MVRYPAPPTRVYHFMAEVMAFKVTVALRARRVEKWIHGGKRDFLDAATTKCVSLDSEFTDPRAAGDQRAAVLQLLPQVLKEFLQDMNIKFFGATIDNDGKMMHHYDIRITSAYDHQKLLPNPTNRSTPSLYDLAIYTIGTNLEKKKKQKYKKMDVAAQEK
ncbi:uncharacterized protein [Lolium perenne]|uniref:uncharacterized protein n=1 Tax=Lolium perenne TaxID=4522 RepID=UPI0021F60A22|nr:uncharacterized protein LOC127310703 [Lolium perenne]